MKEGGKRIIVAIDPGSTESAYVVCDEALRPVAHGKVLNNDIYVDVLKALEDNGIEMWRDEVHLAIEMIASYGMPVGKEVFDTCVWIGIFQQQFAEEGFKKTRKIYRAEEKTTICHSTKANDSTIRQALVDRFAYGVSNKGKGTKKEPGWFYGFRADVWQAYAVAITYHDKYIKGELNG